MSKASEYTRQLAVLENLNRPLLRAGEHGDQIARVSNSGHLEITYRASMSPKIALEFADWIYDTFGEANEIP